MRQKKKQLKKITKATSYQYGLKQPEFKHQNITN